MGNNKLINNADIWLEYVNDFNIYWQENDENKQQQIIQKMQIDLQTI